MTDVLKDAALQAVDRARTKGATAADVFIRADEAFFVSVRLGEIDQLKESASRSLRLRLFLGKRTATSQTSDLSPSAVDGLVDETVEMARLTSEDESSGLPDGAFFPSEIPDLHLFDAAWSAVAPEARIEMARRAEAAALKADPSVTNSDGAWFEYRRSRTVLANTLGFAGSYESSSGALAAIPVATADGGMQRDYWCSIVRRLDQLESPENIGRKAAERAVRRLRARKVKTCRIPVVFDPLMAQTLVRHIFDAVAGDAIYRRRSFLVDKLDQSVAAPDVTIVDDARLPGGLGSSPFDDEGVSTQTTPIIDQGVLRNYLHSAYSARKLGAKPTGNGTRAGTGSVGVGPTNFFLKPGRHTPEEIVASVESGLYVVELIGAGVNSVNGEYSRGVTGLWIEKGKFAYPVHEVTIAGNLREMLQDVEMIGNDIAFMGSIAAPTVKIRSMVLSGD